MSEAKYPNRNALNQALDHYLDAMFQFVSECLDEQSIRDFLRLQSSDNLREEIEVKDIANLIKSYSYWSKCFKPKFKIIDRDDTRYYDARSVTSLIIEGRNQLSHQRLRELDPEFTRSQLFLIAEVLGKINRSDAQRAVEDIRDKLFDDTAAQLEAVSKAVEAEKVEYKKSIATVEKRLAAAEKDNDKLSKQRDDNAAKLDKQTEELEKLSGQLVSVKLSEKENEKHRNSISKQLEQVQAAHSTCEERLTSTEIKRDDYKKRLETASKELEEAETEWQACEDSLVAMQNLFTASTIGNMVFPPFETDSTVRILDRRGMDKGNFLLDLLEQKQPAIIYVQCEEMTEFLLKRVVPEKADIIGAHNERTSEAEERKILEKLKNGELIAVASNTTFSTLASSHFIEHFVFCHLVPSLDKFFKQCEPAFESEKDTYLHLIYNRKTDVEGLDKWLTQKYPDRETLINLHRALKDLVEVNGDFIKFENLYGKLDIARLKVTELGLETGLAIFEELQLLEQNDEGIRLLPPSGRKLEEASEIYRRGEQMEEEIAEVREFQLEQPIERIWEEILEKLDVDSKKILRESSTHRVSLRVSEPENGVQPVTDGEQDEATALTVDVWPQRGMSAFNSLRERAARNFSDTSNTVSAINERNLSAFGGEVSSPLGGYDLESPIIEEADVEDYRNKYDLAMQFAREQGINTLEEGIAQLIKDKENPHYDFTEDETNMLRAFQNALRDFRKQLEQSAEAVEDDNTMENEKVEVEPTRANAKVPVEDVREILSRSADGEANSELAEEDSEKKPEVKQSEFWQPIRAGEFGELFAGKPVPVRDDGYISKRIRGVEIILSFRKNRSYVSFICWGENRIERRDKIIALFPEAYYDYSPHESPQRAGFRFPVINKGKDHPEDWDEIRKKLVAMGTDIYNKIDESNL